LFSIISFVHTLLIYLHTKIYILSYNDSPIAFIKPKSTQISSNCHIIPQFTKQEKLINVAYFGWYNPHTKYQDPNKVALALIPPKKFSCTHITFVDVRN
jgi:hypothetical protein